jgi:L-seryl-tRNA(Ser) seleniumtransferase
LADPAGYVSLFMSDIFQRLELHQVINVSGTETERGGAPVCQEALTVVSELCPHSVQMLELQAAASRAIARAYGCEAGCVTGCTAGSISIAMAAAMTGRNVGRAEQLPDTTGMKNEVIVPKAHVVSYGHDVTQSVRITGAKVVEIGFATELSRYQIEHAIGEQTAAALFVVSHLTPQNKITTLKAFAEICHAHHVPVIVDAASQPDPHVYLEAGADLVLFSTQKALAGLTGGVIAGKMEAVQACMYQQHGIGRPMKPGKETVVGAIAAIERWEKTDWDAEQLSLAKRMGEFADRLCSLPGFSARVAKSQVCVTVDPQEAGISASCIARKLLNSDPMVVVWDHHAPAGELRLTLKLVSDQQANIVCEAITDIVQSEALQADADDFVEGPGERMARELSVWPGY